MAKTARPDGYTISQLTISAFRMPHMQKVDWDPLADFTYIIGVSGYTFGIVVKSRLAVQDLQRPHRVRARPIPASSPTPRREPAPRCISRWKRSARKAGVQFLHVPFKGYADGAQALMGGHVMAQVDSTGWGTHRRRGHAAPAGDARRPAHALERADRRRSSA